MDSNVDKSVKILKRNFFTVKIYYGLIILILIALISVIGSLAWFTLSTSPELSDVSVNFMTTEAVRIGTTNDLSDYNFYKEIQISNDMAGLKPISTVDGINWFVCKYDVDGNVLSKDKAEDLGISQYEYLKFPLGGNLTKEDETNNLQATSDSNIQVSAADYGYYIYKDIYLLSPHGCEIYLVNPYSVDGMEVGKIEGTFVKTYKIEDNEIKLIDGGADTSIRLGFKNLGQVYSASSIPNNATPNKYSNEVSGEKLIYTDDINEDFIILEPNADMRYRENRLESNTGVYVDTFSLGETVQNQSQSYNQLSGYIQTYPIRINEELVDEAESIDTSKSINSIKEELSRIDGSPNILDENSLIVQSKSLWNSSENIDDINEVSFSRLGKFRSGNEFYTNYRNDNTTEYTISNIENTSVTSGFTDANNNIIDNQVPIAITKLTAGIPNKVRVYIWVEGQDVDCWNEIISDKIMISLEFVTNEEV